MVQRFLLLVDVDRHVLVVRGLLLLGVVPEVIDDVVGDPPRHQGVGLHPAVIPLLPGGDDVVELVRPGYVRIEDALRLYIIYS